MSHHRLVFTSLIVGGTVLLAYFAHAIFFRIATLRGKQGAHSTRAQVFATVRNPARWLVLTAAARIAIAFLPIPQEWEWAMHKGFALLLIALFGWLLISLVYALETIVLSRYDLEAEDNLAARRARTQTLMIRRLAIALITVLDIAAMLASFESVRSYGAGLFASAGLASLVLATAARSTLGNILAGLQIAFSEPIRIDDVVVVEGEWGRIEEITTTYVQVKIWDQRRLILPLTYFIEKPFQNWTRRTSDLLGTAFIYCDYTVPVKEIRARLREIVQENPLWDGKVCGTQVTDLKEHTMEIRLLVSSHNSSALFDLRCEVREKMIAWLVEKFPLSLPRTRSQVLGHGRVLEHADAQEEAAIDDPEAPEA